MSANRHHYGRPLQVIVENGALVIRIRTFAITDAEKFADDVRAAMLLEREDGSSSLSDFLDKMTEAAVDDGSEACECDQRIKHGATASIETWATSKVQTSAQGKT